MILEAYADEKAREGKHVKEEAKCTFSFYLPYVVSTIRNNSACSDPPLPSVPERCADFQSLGRINASAYISD